MTCSRSKSTLASETVPRTGSCEVLAVLAHMLCPLARLRELFLLLLALLHELLRVLHNEELRRAFASPLVRILALARELPAVLVAYSSSPRAHT